MKAPKKIYFSQTEDGRQYFTPAIPFEREFVEYVCKDVFIEKALKFIKTNVDRIVNNQYGVCIGCMDVEFKNYMEGE